ncbi:hypothetical protein [Leptolyngbya sp. GGD]|nr:hypothetical protein [Leptolyngbya sp. GGD]MCY6493083.1 hypothetical protein [Leptolyngbya sp. GGD]
MLHLMGNQSMEIGQFRDRDSVISFTFSTRLFTAEHVLKAEC